jgi:pyruvate dehydrogenase E2 component (dihydrolipoamide acetyltransferase)
MPAISAAPSLGIPITPAAAPPAAPAPTADDAKKLLPVANNPLLPGSTASQPDVRQILSQIMVILQSLMGSLGNGGTPSGAGSSLPSAASVLPTSLSVGAADAAGAGNAGNAGNCPAEAGAAGAGAAAPASAAAAPAAKPAAPAAAPAPAAPAPAPAPAAAPAPTPAPVPAPAPVMPAGIPSIGMGGFTGVNNLTISGLPPAPTLPQAPTSFFTPIATPGVPAPGAPAPAPAAAPAAAPAPAAGAAPVAKIPLTSGEELQQRIQTFNRANPTNMQGLAQFLTNSYNNTTQFVLQPDGNLLYGVAGKTFVIAATGLTPRQEVAVPAPPAAA